MLKLHAFKYGLHKSYFHLEFNLTFLIEFQSNMIAWSVLLNFRILMHSSSFWALHFELTNLIMWTPSWSYQFVYSLSTFLAQHAPHPHHAFSRLISITKITLGVLPQAKHNPSNVASSPYAHGSDSMLEPKHTCLWIKRSESRKIAADCPPRLIYYACQHPAHDNAQCWVSTKQAMPSSCPHSIIAAKRLR